MADTPVVAKASMPALVISSDIGTVAEQEPWAAPSPAALQPLDLDSSNCSSGGGSANGGSSTYSVQIPAATLLQGDSEARKISGSGSFGSEEHDPLLHSEERKKNQLLGVLEKSYKRALDVTRQSLDEKMTSLKTAMNRAKTASVFFTSTPFQAALCKPEIQGILFIMICVFTFLVIHHGQYVAQSGRIDRYKVFRFTTLELRNGSWAMAPNIKEFGLLDDGFPIRFDGAEVSDNSLTIKLDEPVSFNGWYWQSSKDLAWSEDPAMFQFLVSWDGESWKDLFNVKGSAKYNLDNLGTESTDRKWYDSCEKRGCNNIWDFRPSWSVILYGVVVDAVCLTGFSLTLILAVCGREKDAKWCFLFMFLLASVITSAAAVGAEGEERTTSIVIAIGTLIFPVMIIYDERSITYALTINGLFDFVTAFVAMYEVHDGNYDPILYQFVVGSFHILAATVISVNRVWIIHTSKALVKPDKLKYDSIWKEVSESADGAVAVQKLEATVEKIAVNCSGHPRHYSKPSFMSTRPPSGGASCCTKPDVSGDKQGLVPTASLSQLYVEATCLHHVMLQKVQLWAHAWKGLFPRRPSSPKEKPVFHLWRLASEHQEIRDSIKWGEVKNPSRAIEKVLRSYRGDPSRLVDICRQTIVFERVEELTACLEAIREDKEVVVERIKNRYSVSFDSELSAGYRDVALNLRFVSEEAKNFDLEFHVCELQLVITGFAIAKNDEGHKRYVQFRNSRGE